MPTITQNTAAAALSPEGIDHVPFSAALKLLHLFVPGILSGLSLFNVYFMHWVQHTFTRRVKPKKSIKVRPRRRF